MEALLSLTDLEKEVAALHFVDELPQALVASRLGLSLRAVESCVYRAAKKLPVLRTLRHRGAPRPRVTPFSNVGPAHAPFNLDAA